jgi:predicted transcriptional regulator
LLDDDSRFLFERYGFIKSESKENCKICKILERLAYENTKDYLEMMGITQPPLPTDIVNWMDTQHTVEIRELPLKVHHGAIWYDNENDEWVIQLSKDDSPVTKRFTLFHEAFHIVCHSKTPSVVKKRGDVAGSFHDFMADYFATCIAMPREWVTDKWAEVRDLDKMARIFAVPRSSMFVRLRQMGLI